MENFDGESQDGLEAKEEKQAPVPPKLRFKLQMKLIDQETDIEEGKKADHSGSLVSSKALEGPMNGNDAVYGEENFTCKICEKRSSSQQSLWGHMRCHSERNRRGLKPLVNSSRPISTTSPDRDDDGPAGVRADQSSMKNDEDDEVESVKDAVYGLMLLATGDEFYKNAPSKHDEDEIRAWVKKNHLSAEEAGSPSSKKRDDDEDKTQMDKEADDDLGKNSKLMISDTCSVKNADQSPTATTAHGNNMSIKNAGQSQEQVMVARGGGTRKCKICGMLFPCGPSLGGHMRKHRNAPPQDEAQAAAGVVEAEAQGEEDQVARKQAFMCLDLNEIPPHDDVD